MSKATLQRRPLVKKILEGADDNLLVIAGLGSSNWDITEAGDRPLNMPLWGGMGAPVGMGLGLALAQPRKRVLVITGDGDMLMSLGSLATVATQQPDNLAIVVLDNEKFGETGRQRGLTSGRTDIAAMAKACGFRATMTVTEQGAAPELARFLFTEPGPVLGLAKIAITEDPWALPEKDGATIAHRFRAALGLEKP
jgi:thiamine pyrophosphate-dependent acetolactate synthase large subunit-like protein